MKKHIAVISSVILLLGCNSTKNSKRINNEPAAQTISVKSNTVYGIPTLDLKKANTLAELPLHCLNIEYPNKLSQTLGGDADIKTPASLHPAFYGCFDWHSAVHGHWSLVNLLKSFPELDNVQAIKERLLNNISKQNIEIEVQYFEGQYNKTFERTYGWAWILKLAEELHTWDDPVARELELNLQPLTDLIVNKYIEFLPKLNYPLRDGRHSNTAFGLSFAYDYALTLNNENLKSAVKERALFFFLKDENCPLSWEPSGSDFLSPCLEEAALMKRLLPVKEYKLWLNDFLPQLKNEDFKLAVGVVSDRTDGHLVHLDGLNFSRAWNLYDISEGLPEYTHLNFIANEHLNYSFPSIFDDDYMGGHWLGSFALYALNTVNLQ